MSATIRRTRNIQYSPVGDDNEVVDELVADDGAKCCGYYSFQVINIAAAILHGVNALVMAIVYFANDKEDRLYAIPTPYSAWVPNNASLPEGDRTYTIETKTTTTLLSLNWLIFSFHLLSFVFQMFAAATDLFEKGLCKYKYTAMIESGRNPLRFIEYALSASIMLVCIALVSGIRSWTDLSAIVLLNVYTQLMGLACEYVRRKWVLNFAHVTAWVTIVAAYGIIIAYTVTSITANEVDPPSFVYAIITLQVLLFMSFGFVQLFQLYCNFRYSELAYTVLSLVAKTILGYMIYANVLVGMGRVTEAIVE